MIKHIATCDNCGRDTNEWASVNIRRSYDVSAMSPNHMRIDLCPECAGHALQHTFEVITKLDRELAIKLANSWSSHRKP